MQDSGAFGIFLGRSSWSANEEVRLLDAIEQFGFGNWEDIAKHIETRSPEGKVLRLNLIQIHPYVVENKNFDRDQAIDN